MPPLNIQVKSGFNFELPKLFAIVKLMERMVNILIKLVPCRAKSMMVENARRKGTRLSRVSLEPVSLVDRT